MKEKIRHLCEKNNISFTQLEKTLGFANGLISKWDVSVPSVEKAKKVADHFHITVDELIGESK